ncbi:MAG TPA: cytochrome P450 [Candidatus Thermoplasmatota archaeon]|jgi:cytochrome P450|nr:cytochrome P450 [Candidatus Thermoplasmatota archaeon]
MVGQVVPTPPAPRGSLLGGHVQAFRRDPLGFLERCRPYGPVVALRIGHKPVYLLTQPEGIHDALVLNHQDFVKDWRTRGLRVVMGDGLLVSEGDLWKRQRRMMQPAFHRERILQYGRSMVQHAQRTARGWRDGLEVDAAQEMANLTLGIVCDTLFGSGPEAAEGEVAELLPFMSRQVAWRTTALVTLPAWLPTPANARFRRDAVRLDTMIHRLIAERRGAGKPGMDLLSLLLQMRDEAGEGMTDAQLRDEVMTLFLAGHETTANALSWLWVCLAQHPEVEEKLVAELRAVLRGDPPSPGDLPRLTYTDKVVRETLRLYPPAWLLGREVARTTTVAGHSFPEGATVWLSPWLTHRDPALFEEPLAFRPERWTDDALRKLPPFAYWPFGGGPRTCIGQPFAMMELVLVLAALLPAWRIVPRDAKVAPWPVVTLRPKGGVPAVVRRRA